MKKETKDLIKGISVVIIYIMFIFFKAVPLLIVGIDPTKLSETVQHIYIAALEFLILAIYYYMFRKEINESFLDFKNNFKTYFKTYFKYWGLIILSMIVSNMFVLIFGNGNISENQQTINNLLVTNPIFIIVSSILIAPFLEEFIFRFSFRKIFKNDILFILISGFIFGLLHVVASTEASNFLYIISYGLPGCIFAYLYCKSKNIFIPMSIHFIHNTTFVLLQLLVLIIK